MTAVSRRIKTGKNEQEVVFSRLRRLANERVSYLSSRLDCSLYEQPWTGSLQLHYEGTRGSDDYPKEEALTLGMPELGYRLYFGYEARARPKGVVYKYSLNVYTSLNPPESPPPHYFLKGNVQRVRKWALLWDVFNSYSFGIGKLLPPSPSAQRSKSKGDKKESSGIIYAGETPKKSIEEILNLTYALINKVNDAPDFREEAKSLPGMFSYFSRRKDLGEGPFGATFPKELTDLLSLFDQLHHGQLPQTTSIKVAQLGPPPPFACYLTTACVDVMGLADDGQELETLRAFRDNWLARQPEGPQLIAEYEQVAPRIVKAIQQRPDHRQIFMELYEQDIQTAVRLIKEGKQEEAFHLYKNMTSRLQQQFLGS